MKQIVVGGWHQVAHIFIFGVCISRFFMEIYHAFSFALSWYKYRELIVLPPEQGFGVVATLFVMLVAGILGGGGGRTVYL